MHTASIKSYHRLATLPRQTQVCKSRLSTKPSCQSLSGPSGQIRSRLPPALKKNKLSVFKPLSALYTGIRTAIMGSDWRNINRHFSIIVFRPTIHAFHTILLLSRFFISFLTPIILVFDALIAFAIFVSLAVVSVRCRIHAGRGLLVSRPRILPRGPRTCRRCDIG